MRIASLFICLCLAACGGESPSNTVEPNAAERAIDELQRKYDELAGDQLDAPVQWAAEDIENIGDWDYKVIEIGDDLSAEELEQTLNALGDDRWEAFWVQPSADGYTVLLKKPSISYLSKIPLSQIGRFIIPGGEQGQ